MTSLVATHSHSQRKACQLVGLHRSVGRYQSKKQDDALQSPLQALADERRPLGYRRLHLLLRRAGAQINHKKVYRFDKEVGLQVSQRKGKKSARR